MPHFRRPASSTCNAIPSTPACRSTFRIFSIWAPTPNDFGNLAHYYGEYARIMDHWRAVLPATTLLEIPYESLIQDQQGWTRRMLDFIGLPWDPMCLDFHQTDRAVITTSRWQVRQKIHSASAGTLAQLRKIR